MIYSKRFSWNSCFFSVEVEDDIKPIERTRNSNYAEAKDTQSTEGEDHTDDDDDDIEELELTDSEKDDGGDDKSDSVSEEMDPQDYKVLEENLLKALDTEEDD